ncbi:hypothetical protein B0H16DRAFT_166831 [Mycena metata]|uniref:Uncharacterized protein n=1 Tax=Mycena metata TaxID=1033252 RepID=A0AAD7JX09_9AGAR|nr:hypothetical protein B0H16DRAFT_166831 [Mycena metata]
MFARSFSLLIILALFSAVSNAQTSTMAGSASATNLGSSSSLLHPWSHTTKTVVGVSVTIGVILIIIASYFCCCHAACKANTTRVARDRDVENGTRIGRQHWQAHNSGVPKRHKSMDRRNRETDRTRTDADAPPSYEES